MIAKKSPCILYVRINHIYYDDPKDNTAFERCIDVMSRLMLKYGTDVLDKIEQEKWEKGKKRIAKKRIMCYDTYNAMRGGAVLDIKKETSNSLGS